MEDVKSFFHKHYTPSNAILCIAGNISLEETKTLVEKWYGDIPSHPKPERILPTEPKQTEFRELTIERAVPANAFYYAFKMPERKSFEYYVADFISDALGRNESSRLYSKLKKELQLVNSISAYITGSTDEGLLVVSGKLNDGITFEQLETELFKELEVFCASKMENTEKTKLYNKIRTAKEFQEQGLLNRAMNLCIYELLGDANGVNEETQLYQQITPEQIQQVAREILRKENCSVLRVKATKQ
jgi:predicted Zn-dependent peptidase